MQAVTTAHLQPERITRVFMAACAGTPKLFQCSRESIAVSLLLCSQLGLEPNTPLGQVYLIPYGQDLQAQIGYKGLLELVRRTGEVKRINAQVFHRQEIESGAVKVSIEPPELSHDWTGKEYTDRDIVGAYCRIEMIDGTIYQEIMGRGELDKIAGLGNTNSPAWKNHRGRMYRKIVIKRLINGGSVPISMEKLAESKLLDAVSHDDQAYDIRPTSKAADAMGDFAAAIDTTAAPAIAADVPDPDQAPTNGRRSTAITEASMAACGPDHPAARVAAARKETGTKMVRLRQLAGGHSPESWSDDLADSLVDLMRPAPPADPPTEADPAPPPAPSTPDTAQNRKPQAQAVHNIGELEGLAKAHGIQWDTVTGIAANEYDLGPNDSEWTMTDLTDIWTAICDRA